MPQVAIMKTWNEKESKLAFFESLQHLLVFLDKHYNYNDTTKTFTNKACIAAYQLPSEITSSGIALDSLTPLVMCDDLQGVSWTISDQAQVILSTISAYRQMNVEFQQFKPFIQNGTSMATQAIETAKQLIKDEAVQKAHVINQVKQNATPTQVEELNEKAQENAEETPSS